MLCQSPKFHEGLVRRKYSLLAWGSQTDHQNTLTPNQRLIVFSRELEQNVASQSADFLETCLPPRGPFYCGLHNESMTRGWRISPDASGYYVRDLFAFSCCRS